MVRPISFDEVGRAVCRSWVAILGLAAMLLILGLSAAPPLGTALPSASMGHAYTYDRPVVGASARHDEASRQSDAGDLGHAQSATIVGTNSSSILLVVAAETSPSFGPGAAHIDDPALQGPRFFRGAPPGEEPTFTPRPSEFRVDPDTGLVRPTHGLSVFDNPASVAAKGFDPYEVDTSSIPDGLRVIQRGIDPAHFEIVPEPGANLTPEQYVGSLQQIETLP